MHLTGIARLGRDAELRVTPGGDKVVNLALAFNYGRKDDSGNRPTQWVDGSLWGERAEKLAPYLVKGQQLYVVVEEPHIEFYQSQGEDRAKMVGRVADVRFAGSPPGDSGSQSQPQQGRQQSSQQSSQQSRQNTRQTPPQRQQESGGFGNFDDDIPF